MTSRLLRIVKTVGATCGYDMAAMSGDFTKLNKTNGNGLNEGNVQVERALLPITTALETAYGECLIRRLLFCGES